MVYCAVEMHHRLKEAATKPESKFRFSFFWFLRFFRPFTKNIGGDSQCCAALIFTLKKCQRNTTQQQQNSSAMIASENCFDVPFWYIPIHTETYIFKNCFARRSNDNNKENNSEAVLCSVRLCCPSYCLVAGEVYVAVTKNWHFSRSGHDSLLLSFHPRTTVQLPVHVSIPNSCNYLPELRIFVISYSSGHVT